MFKGIKGNEQQVEAIETNKLIKEQKKREREMAKKIQAERKMKEKMELQNKKVSKLEKISRQFNMAGTSSNIKGMINRAKNLKKTYAKTKRAYTKSANWYKTRVSKSGTFRQPSRFKGMDSDRVMPSGEGVGGNLFNVGRVAGYDNNILAVGTGERMNMSFKSPINNEESNNFEKANQLLNISNNQSKLLDISNKQSNMLDLSYKKPSKDNNKEKREIKWF